MSTTDVVGTTDVVDEIEPGQYSLEEAAELGVYDPASGHVVAHEGLVIFKACNGCGCSKKESTCVVFVRRRREEL